MSLIKEIENSTQIRKIFGKRELFIIKKQLLGMHLSPSEKTRLSRDIRKKFEVIKTLSEYSNEFNIKHGSEIKRRIENIKAHLLDSEYSTNIKRIYLFGSVADKTHLFRSDIDIAVEFFDIDLKTATKFGIKFNYNDKIQISVYNILPGKIKNEINKKGKLIYEK
jgi:predicted nucleotidyltransferase